MSDRRHNDPQSPHERARVLASDRLDEPLTATDAIWLDDHLHGCDECRTIAAAYAEDRALLRSLPTPQPPRDLWARTSVALDRERSASRGSSSRRTVGLGWRVFPAIVAVVIVGVAISQSGFPAGPGGTPGIGLSSQPPAASGLPGSTLGPGSTPLAVDPGDVAWINHAANGKYTMNIASVAAVCPADAAPSPDCAPLDVSAKQLVSFDSRPGSVVLAPEAAQAAVVESSASTTGGRIFVVPLARAAPRPSPTATPPSPTPSAGASASPSAGTTEPPSASPSTTAHPTRDAGSSPSPSVAPSASTEPSLEPSPSARPSAAPTDTPVPTATATAMLAIVDHVVVVGGDAAYSPDGAWLAFSARPAAGSDGPDVYVWHTGDDKARMVTTDHGSVFSAWVGDRIVASRAASVAAGKASPSADTATPRVAARQPTSFLLDPATGKEVGPKLSGAWRPVVDPSGRWMVYWTGSLVLDPTARTWLPNEGRLVVDRWPSGDGDTSSVDEPSPLLTPKTGTSLNDWEVRWDPSGRFVAVWAADPLDPGLGRLSLVAIDHTSGRVETDRKPMLRDAPALPGFAIGDGRVAWASPPGQDGEGSRLMVLAWKGPDAGRTRTEPASSLEDIVVVR